MEIKRRIWGSAADGKAENYFYDGPCAGKVYKEAIIFAFDTI